MLVVKMTGAMLDSIHADLDRPHAFALERVAFLTCGAAILPEAGVAMYVRGHHPVDDEDYEDVVGAGATIGSEAFRKILNLGLSSRVSILHVHRHDHRGRPRPSRLDAREYARFVPDFFNVRPDMQHGALILSFDGAWGEIRFGRHRQPVRVDSVEAVGQRIVRL